LRTARRGPTGFSIGLDRVAVTAATATAEIVGRRLGRVWFVQDKWGRATFATLTGWVHQEAAPRVAERDEQRLLESSLAFSRAAARRAASLVGLLC
jgi:SH3-like domain-containing protein